MGFLVFALPILALPASAWAVDEGLPASMALGQDPERRAPSTEGPTPVLEYVTTHSRFEAGALYTRWDGELDLEGDVGVYVRWGVNFLHGLSATLAYRHWDYESSELSGTDGEHVLIRGLLAGVGWTHALTPELDVEAHGAAGFQRWETGLHSLSDDTGWAASVEGAVRLRLHEALRARLGAALDLAGTDFHQDSRGTLTSLTFLFGLELAW